MSNRNPFDEMIAGIDALAALRQDMLARAQARTGAATQAERRVVANPATESATAARHLSGAPVMQPSRSNSY